MRQKGFTLLELLVALGVGTIILMGAVLSIQRVMLGTDRSNSQTMALTDINQAALAIKKDLLMTQSTNLTDNSTPKSSVLLSWIDYTSFESSNYTSHSSSYTLNGTALWRTYDSVPGIVGRNITSIGFTQNGKYISVTISATGPGIRTRTETLTFGAHIRAEELEE